MSWRVSLPCTKDEAALLPDEVPALAGHEPPPVLMTGESDPARPDAWRIDAYFATRPMPADLAAIAALAPSAAAAPEVERLADEDWVTMSQAGFAPIRAGRFFVRTSTADVPVPDGMTSFTIDAGRAFGTGQHDTTAGCLAALDRLKAGGMVARSVADIGTGTGLLAFAALALWPAARVIASDIDPVAVAVAADNAALNGVALGRGRGRVELVAAPGLAHRRLRARAPHDLIVANILAGPLIELAPAIGAALAPGGRLILAGLLSHQADGVLAAYRRQGLRGAARGAGDWPTLVLRKARRPAGPARRRSAATTTTSELW